MKKGFYYSTRIGCIGLVEEDGYITNLFFERTVQPDLFEIVETELLTRAAQELEEYLLGTRRQFDLPLLPQGTPFERTVWDALLQIPYGQTRTYAQIAEQIGKPTAGRAVGRANGHNPISLFIPCHRVVGKDGSTVGYAGGIELKLRLLAHEEKHRVPE